MKSDAAIYGKKSDGTEVLRGHNAVDPKGHLVLLPGDRDLPGPSWRWATDADIAEAELAEQKRAAKEAAAIAEAELEARERSEDVDDAESGGPLQ